MTGSMRFVVNANLAAGVSSVHSSCVRKTPTLSGARLCLHNEFKDGGCEWKIEQKLTREELVVSS